MIKKKPAFVLIFSLLSMGIVTILTQQLMKSVSVGIAFSRQMVLREQVKMFVYGGIAIATAQLEQCYPEEKKKQGAEPAAGQQSSAQPQGLKRPFSFKTFILSVLPHLNRWQTFELTDKIDGVDAQIKVCIVAEEGKIPFTQVFDEPARELTDPAHGFLQQFPSAKKGASSDFVTKFTAFLKGRTHRIVDISALLPFAHQVKVPLWYAPPEFPTRRTAAGEVKNEKGKPVPAACALQDLFTLWGQGSSLNPLLLSNALCVLSGLRPPQPNDAQKRKDQYKQLAENYDKIKSLKGDELWKALGALYDAKPKLSAEFNTLFSLEVEPRFYSVLSCATVAGVTQQLIAILEHVPPTVAPAERREQRQKKKEIQPLFAIRRLYWL